MTELFKKVLDAPYIHLDENTASFYFERVGDELKIYFECSNGKTDWKNNFDFPAKPYRDMQDKWYAHRGFLRVWKTIEPHLAEHIADTTIKQITIAGYSHGAAIALLCHEYCKFHRPDAYVFGVGFGAPRVVWGRIPKNVRERFQGFFVVRNGRDLVTHVPPALFGFKHASGVLSIGKSKGIIRDHYPNEYADAIAETGWEL